MMATTKRKATFATITAAGSMQGQPSMIVSTVNPDRMGDRVLPEGAQLEHFLRSPCLTWSHDYSAIPIGTVTHIDVEPGKGIRASWRWLEGDAFADRVKNAWAQGVIRSSSIGFRVLERERDRAGGDDITKWELLEIALVAVPANPEAVRVLKSLGLHDDHDPIVARLHADADPVVLRVVDDDPTYEVDPDDLKEVLARLIPRLVREHIQNTVRETLERVINQARGRVPDRVDSAELAGLAPTKTRGIRR